MSRSALLRVDSAIVSFNIIDGTPDILFLANADFAFPIKVPDGLCQQLSDIRMLSLHDIPDTMTRHNIILTTLECSIQAEKSDDIGWISVEGLSTVIKH
jgi:hypothetical protein